MKAENEVLSTEEFIIRVIGAAFSIGYGLLFLMMISLILFFLTTFQSVIGDIALATVISIIGTVGVSWIYRRAVSQVLGVFHETRRGKLRVSSDSDNFRAGGFYLAFCISGAALWLLIPFLSPENTIISTIQPIDVFLAPGYSIRDRVLALIISGASASGLVLLFGSISGLFYRIQRYWATYCPGCGERFGMRESPTYCPECKYPINTEGGDNQ
jgi:hypothetical protein